MNTQRLERAAEVVQELIDRGLPTEFPPGEEPDVTDKFNISGWGYRTSCGTVACLGGWMTLDPELRREGLRHTGDVRPGSLMLQPVFGDEIAGAALMDFFGISGDEMLYIFGGGNPNSLEKGLSRIQRVLRGEYDPDTSYADQGDE